MAELPFDPTREPYVSLASFRRNGREVRTPVWVAAEGSKLYVYTNVRSGKVKRIRAHGRVRLAACDARGRLRDDDAWVDARARMVDPQAERALFDHAFDLFVAKYGWQMRLALLASRVSGRYADRGIVEIAV